MKAAGEITYSCAQFSGCANWKSKRKVIFKEHPVVVPLNKSISESWYICSVANSSNDSGVVRRQAKQESLVVGRPM